LTQGSKAIGLGLVVESIGELNRHSAGKYGDQRFNFIQEPVVSAFCSMTSGLPGELGSDIPQATSADWDLP
jgi:hypothetical protein